MEHHLGQHLSHNRILTCDLFDQNKSLGLNNALEKTKTII